MQTPEETLELGRGSCRDSAWLLVQLCRHLGLAARFVSGYLIQLVADEKPLDGPAGPDQPTSPTCTPGPKSTCPAPGWIGLDPTSGLLAGEGHIPLACTADPQSAAPDHRLVLAGPSWTRTTRSTRSSSSSMSVDADRRDAARDEAVHRGRSGHAIDALGQRIDADLREWDVRLTMGGEPTFVCIDDRDAPEWNIAALGPQKRRQG